MAVLFHSWGHLHIGSIVAATVDTPYQQRLPFPCASASYLNLKERGGQLGLWIMGSRRVLAPLSLRSQAMVFGCLVRNKRIVLMMSFIVLKYKNVTSLLLENIQIELFSWSLQDKVLGSHVPLLCVVLLASWLLEHIWLHI